MSAPSMSHTAELPGDGQVEAGWGLGALAQSL
jgi:hypothetical protein